MIRDTRHPIAQLMDCVCESGRRWIECCGSEQLDDPCLCESGKTFRDCCAITVERLEQFESVTA